MKVFTESLIVAALCCSSLQAGAVPIDVAGTATASGFANTPSGFIGTPVPGPFDEPLTAAFELVYEDAFAPADGNLSVALTSFMLTMVGPAPIVPVDYDPSNSSAVLTFVANMLVGVTVGGDANGGPTITDPGTNDFLFSNVDGTQAFRYTAAGFPAGPAPLTGEFDTLFTPDPTDTDIGQVSVTFTATPQRVPLPGTSLLLVAGLGLLAARRRGQGTAESDGVLMDGGHLRPA